MKQMKEKLLALWPIYKDRVVIVLNIILFYQAILYLFIPTTPNQVILIILGLVFLLRKLLLR